MNVFQIRHQLISEYSEYVRSFINIRDQKIREFVANNLDVGVLWPEPLIQLNPSFEPGATIDQLVDERILHDECRRIFRRDKKPGPGSWGEPLQLHRHQEEGIRRAVAGRNYVLTTGTASGKSLAYLVPIVNHVLQRGSGRGIQAIIVYPMNALANSQAGELEKFLCHGYDAEVSPVKFARYTGQEDDERRRQILTNPPDILLTNYVMLELILTRLDEGKLVSAARDLRFLVLDELHTYRGRQGADVALLVRRVRDRMAAGKLQCVGTSATLAGGGTVEQQHREVASLAGAFFGAALDPEDVIGETLRRMTPPLEKRSEFTSTLERRVADQNYAPPQVFEDYIRDPLSVWIETNLGLTEEPDSGRLLRAVSRSLTGDSGAAKLLAQQIGLPEERCRQALEKHLLAAYTCSRHPITGNPAFAFRLHQFISRGNTVYASIESERYLSMYGQQFVPGDRSRLLLPLVFCRECGQEYYCVHERSDADTNQVTYEARELNDLQRDDGHKPGFLHYSADDPWPVAMNEIVDRVPEDWCEDTSRGRQVKSDRKKYLPVPAHIGPAGHVHFIGAPFRFCLRCGVAYTFRKRSDFGELASLSSDGRSTATTVLSLSAIRSLKAEATLPANAKKLLSFTDNRQDASLQAGHFNDFVEVGMLRAALYRAVSARSDGLRHDELPDAVFRALALPVSAYARDPDVKFHAKTETDRAFREVLGYRIYRDLKRGWRVTLPNLEQCGLLEIEYESLRELCEAEEEWQGCHPALLSATPDTRFRVARTVLDFMRRSLGVQVNYLAPPYQDRVRQLSAQHLCEPWAIDETENLEYAAIVVAPHKQERIEEGGFINLSARSGFGIYVRRSTTFPDHEHRINTDETEAIIGQLLARLRIAGIVELTNQPASPEHPHFYQVAAHAMRWRKGDGKHAFHDPIRVPRQSSEGARVNPYFIRFYNEIAASSAGLEAREHTAQVQSDVRIQREKKFSEGALPILYCSPTMELGVDISQLNAVNMRNIPPTPANYAQRSGRAGRSGQPALVFSYCTSGSSHDQYFFKRPQRMVSGQVAPPRLDLSNEDLVKAHVHSVWLAESGISLGTTLKDVLDLSGDPPSLEVLTSIRAQLDAEHPRLRAKERSEAIFATMRTDLAKAEWYTPRWLDDTLARIALSFEQACMRWRSMYRAALAQAKAQDGIIRDATRAQSDIEHAKRLRAEAESQLRLLTEADNVRQSDFYSYRYFASEGFLPGYSFPRLPLSAFIPARRRTKEEDEYLSRPRFLAISEFGPRAFIYHEGSRYITNRVLLPVREGDGNLLTQRAKQCLACGYLHPVFEGDGVDRCERCDGMLGAPMPNLFELQNVITKRRDRINSDEEERTRLGYEIRTGVRFAEQGGVPSHRTATIELDGDVIGRLQYGHAAEIWRVNLGWRRRSENSQPGFILDIERGYWQRSDYPGDDEEDRMSNRTQRVIPFVRDHRNCLVFEPGSRQSDAVMASLAAALKNAIQIRYQLEDNELAAESLPDDKPDNRRLVLLYESAEGGAGVLRHVFEDPEALRLVAREALTLCHFDADTGEDRRRAETSTEDCEAACYDCLMHYGNQREHKLLDRHAIRAILLQFARARVVVSSAPKARTQHFSDLETQCESELERKWLRIIDAGNCRLPTHAQYTIPSCQTRPDFFYAEQYAAIYVDGPPHDYPDRQERDRSQENAMEDLGYTVIRFHHEADWPAIIARYPSVFGRKSATAGEGQ
jgi:ATP-dependent helicase YprA (DUF1998 family)/very-short-patch-repair endonuclease